MSLRRRGIVRRAAQNYVDLCHQRGDYPTSEQIVEAAVSAAAFTIPQQLEIMRRWMRRDVLAMMEERAADTRARRYLLVPDDQGVFRWHPHQQLTFSTLDDATRYVTRPQNDRQSRAERRRDIEREVIEHLESASGQAVTVAEAWPDILRALEAEGLGL